MSLFQIAEPGESRAKEACKGSVIGIDLGTTHSLVARVVDGTPQCLAGAEGPLLSSVVHYRRAGAPLLGEAAAAQAATAPQDTIVSVKRFMGRSLADVQGRGGVFPYRFVTAEDKDAPDDGVIRMRVAGPGGPAARVVTPVEVSAEILRALRERAEELLGAEPAGAVITVPAYFDDAQRQATRDAGRLAGLDVLRLLNEPTAAALAYGLDKRKSGRFAIYDLGGGTFDVSILDLRDGVFTVLSTAGDTALGGDDMDRALAEVVLAQVAELPGGLVLRARISEDPGLRRRLLSLSRTLKHALTQAEVASAALGELGGEAFTAHTVTVTRAAFEAVLAPILARTSAPCRRALKDAELAAADLDGVVLVGGATRVPAVKRHVAALFQREPLCDLDPDQVVALGAAVQAEIIASERSDVLLIDVTPLSLGLELMGGVVERVLPRNSRIPTGAKQVFTTYADGQTGFNLHVVQGERETAAECRSLARFQLRGIPPMAAGMARLEVNFVIDENGILRVSARELTSGLSTGVEVKPSYGLSEEQIEQMLLDSYDHAEEDVRARLLIEQRVEAERILQALKAALLRDGHLLDAAERATIDEAAAALQAAHDGEDHRLIAQRAEALDEVSKEFAQRRMNRGLSQAVAGRSLKDVEAAVHYDDDADVNKGCAAAMTEGA